MNSTMRCSLMACLITLGLAVGGTADECFCRKFHPQEMICQTPFVGEVRVTSVYDEEPEMPGNIVAAKVEILKIYKGTYQDFQEGAVVYLHTLDTADKCTRDFELGDHIIGARPYKGGLFLDKCDFYVRMDTLVSQAQADAILDNIRSKRYQLGCEGCRIKRPMEKCFVYPDECQSKCEFPVHTAACVPTGQGGVCQWERGATLSPPTATPKSTINPLADALQHETPPAPTEREEPTKKSISRLNINTVTYPYSFKPTKRPQGVASFTMKAIWPKWFRKR